MSDDSDPQITDKVRFQAFKYRELIEELEAVADEWEEKYAEYDNDPSQIPNGGHQMMCRQINDCSGELRSLIQEYRGNSDE